MAASGKVFIARLAGLVVLGPDGESIGRVRDVALTVRYDRQAPRVIGLVVELLTRRRIFVPMGPGHRDRADVGHADHRKREYAPVLPTCR